MTKEIVADRISTSPEYTLCRSLKSRYSVDAANSPESSPSMGKDESAKIRSDIKTLWAKRFEKEIEEFFQRRGELELKAFSYGKPDISFELESEYSCVRYLVNIEAVKLYQGATEISDVDYRANTVIDEEQGTWRFSTPYITLSGTFGISSNEKYFTAEDSTAHDNWADKCSHFQNMRLPPPTLHVAQHSTQVSSSLPIGGCPTCGKLAQYECACKECSNQKCKKKARGQMKRKGNLQKTPLKSACNHWQMPLLRSLSILEGVSRNSTLSLMNIQRLLEKPSPCCPSSGMLYWNNSGLEPWGIFPSSSCSSNASMLYANKGNSISSFFRGASN